jgi:hypothetical protein
MSQNSTVPGPGAVPPSPHHIPVTAGPAPEAPPQDQQPQLTPDELANLRRLIGKFEVLLNTPVIVQRIPDAEPGLTDEQNVDRFFDSFYREPKRNARTGEPLINPETGQVVPLVPLVPVQATVAQLLAEIADNTRAAVCAIESMGGGDDDDEPVVDEPPPRRGSSRRPAREERR